MADAPAKESDASKHPARTFSNLALPIADVPLVVESIDEYTTRLSNGASKREITAVKMYRDSAGRMRIERSIGYPDGPSLTIQIFDHEKGFMALLDTESKIAHCVAVPKPEQSGTHVRFIFLGGPLVALAGEKKSNTESLGTKTIAGAEFEGQRLTTAMEAEPSLVSVQEYWISGPLGLIGSMSSSGPDTAEDIRLQRLDRTEPDPALFVIPGDYAVQDLGDLGPNL